ncbi:MAG: beta-galactosidase [Pirellulales bacterium]|nr:beta-galactosidase [Pirellulales bacterium]
MPDISYRDGRFWRDGSPFFLIAADYPYFRDRRDNWQDRLEKQQAAGVNTITFYIPWRHHLRFDERGNRFYDFDGRTKDSRDVIGYMQRIEALGLYMIVKPGPFIHSELNIGGLPDLVSPSFNRAMPAARRHHGRPAFWSYDASILPAALEPKFDDLAREWLETVSEVIRPFVRPGGPVIALQPNDETLYCTSNDPPWQIGYEPSGVRYYQKLLAERYGDLANYNRVHGTEHQALEFAEPPRLADLGFNVGGATASPGDGSSGGAPSPPTPAISGVDPQAVHAAPPGERGVSAIARREDLLRYVDWAEYQWRLRRDIYVRYKQYLDIDLPYLTNYAGITPPIVENVPDHKDHASEKIPAELAPQYPEWWFAMNRIERDAADYHYGMISWLGVAAYDRDVFDRYINTARRARGINMEENWGFGTLYDHRSRYPVVPFFQTLASVAGGATGYVIFTCVNTEYWDPSLDRITKLQCNTFPSHAPIDEHGVCHPMYDTACLLNRWFAKHGNDFLQAEVEFDCAYLLYAPYAAISSWIPDERYWTLADAGIPRCGRQGFEEFSRSLQQAGYAPAMFELDAAPPKYFDKPRALAFHSAFFLDADSQERLAAFIEGGGRLFISGDLPTVDLTWRTYTRLKEAVERAVQRGAAEVAYQRENLFADGRFAERLNSAGIEPNVRTSPDLRAHVYRNGDDYFVFFFNFDVAGRYEKFIEFYDYRLDLVVGSKTSGVVRVTDDRLAGWLVKARNEVEDISDHVRIRLGDQMIEGTGDFSSE